MGLLQKMQRADKSAAPPQPLDCLAAKCWRLRWSNTMQRGISRAWMEGAGSLGWPQDPSVVSAKLWHRPAFLHPHRLANPNTQKRRDQS